MQYKYDRATLLCKYCQWDTSYHLMAFDRARTSPGILPEMVLLLSFRSTIARFPSRIELPCNVTKIRVITRYPSIPCNIATQALEQIDEQLAGHVEIVP